MKKHSPLKDSIISVFLILFCLWGIGNLFTGDKSSVISEASEVIISTEIAEKAHQIKFNPEINQWEGRSHWTRQVQPVLLFVTSWCGACRSLEASLLSNKVDFMRFDLEKDRSASELYQSVTGRKIGPVPVVLVGKRVFVGNRSGEIIKEAFGSI
ncbi:MAG TPA: glutaredoxin family protein [Oligoflexia bacterium]|nr:glutaredoxin family protein [Oligoflexia bacterium]HMP49078.1 glutaredoxin family protein [Oligoflexia bacterium]